MTDKKSKKENEMVEVMQLHPPKLKDSPLERSRITIYCEEQFGFLPEIIFIDKVKGSSNRITVSAAVPEESKKLKKESKKDEKDKEGNN